jgi:uncharacterized RmlC-like cupin family protein
MGRDTLDKWCSDGVKVVSGGHLDIGTLQTPGMLRSAAIDNDIVGSQKLWAGTVEIHPDAKTGPHHHGSLESIIYIISGKARMRWGDALQYVSEAKAGDFIFVPPYVPHQEMNASTIEPLHCVLVRSGQNPVVVNLDIETSEDPKGLLWVDAIHPMPE